MYIEKYSKNALFLLFLIFFIAILSINSINASDISENIQSDSNTDNNIVIDNNVNNAALETSKIESNDDTNNVVVRSKEKSDDEDLIKDNEDKTPISISASDVTMKRYDKSQLIINLNTADPTSIEGKYVKIEMDNKIYWRPIFNSMANLTIYNDVGNYTAICSFNYTNFQYATCTANIEVLENKSDTHIITDNELLEMDYQDGTPYIIQLLDDKNNPIPKGYVHITIDGRTYYKTTDDMGYADIPLNFGAGTYTITTVYTGNYRYHPSNKTSTVIIHKIIPTIESNNVVLYYQNGTPLKAKIMNCYRIGMNNSYITIEINNRTYYKRSNEEGFVDLNLTMKPGNYTAFINYPGNKGYENCNCTVDVTVLSYETRISSENIVKYYRNGTNLEGQILVKNPYTNEETALNGSFITIVVNNRTYYRTTDDEGKFNLSINFKSGNYTALINYKSNRGYEACNLTVNITILNITTKINSLNTHKYYRDDTLFTANLVNQFGQALVGEYLNITIGDKKYMKQTNSNGDINLTVNLESGIYEATIIYNGKNGHSSYKKTVQIIVEDQPINIVSMGADIEKGNNYSVQVYDNYGSTLSNVNVVFEINNRTYYKYTDSNGIASIPINLALNNYNILVKPGTHYKGNYLKETITVYKEE